MTARRPNVLVVMSDEQSHDTMGWTGNPAAVTPQLDRLATESTCFERCYTPFPLCCPSRTSLWTSLMPRHHGVLGNWRPVEPWVQGTGLAAGFAAAGYHTLYTGKWHVPGTTPQAMGWASAHAIPAVVGGQDRGRFIPAYREWAGARGYHFDPDHIENLTSADLETLRERPYGTSSVALEDFLETWQTGVFLDAFDERPAGKPWLAVCSYNAPHFPLLVPEPYDRLVDRTAVRLPASLAEGQASRPREVRESHVAGDYTGLDEQDWVEATAHYLGLCALVDHELGRIREHFEQAGEWEDTIVVFTSDHGDMMGAHGLMEKGHWLHYEEDLRVPLVVRAPGRAPTRVDHLVSVCDVGVTVAELAGVELPGTNDGRSFAAAVGDPTTAPARDHVTAETMLHDGRPGGRGEPFHARDWNYPRDSLNLSVRTSEHRYVFRSHDVEELYDLRADPGETRNLALLEPPPDPALLARLRELVASEVEDVLPAGASLVRGRGAGTGAGAA